MAGITEIQRLIVELADKDEKVRQSARCALIKIGRPAVVPLVKQLKDLDKGVRWDVAKTLAEMRLPSAASFLVNSLINDDPDVRWLSAEGLIALGSISLIPLMEALTQFSGDIQLGRGAHHVLHDLSEGMVHEGEHEYIPLIPLTDELKSIIQPVLDSLEPAGSLALTPEYARIALNQLKQPGN